MRKLFTASLLAFFAISTANADMMARTEYLNGVDYCQNNSHDTTVSLMRSATQLAKVATTERDKLLIISAYKPVVYGNGCGLPKETWNLYFKSFERGAKLSQLAAMSIATGHHNDVLYGNKELADKIIEYFGKGALYAER